MIHEEKLMEMMDILGLPIAAQKLHQLYHSPELANLPTMQVLYEVLSEQCMDTLNKRFETNIRLSSLINRSADIANLKTGNGRIYNDTTVGQVLTFRFVEDRLNVGVYGVTAVEPECRFQCTLIRRHIDFQICCFNRLVA